MLKYTLAALCLLTSTAFANDEEAGPAETLQLTLEESSYLCVPNPEPSAERSITVCHCTIGGQLHYVGVHCQGYSTVQHCCEDKCSLLGSLIDGQD